MQEVRAQARVLLERVGSHKLEEMYADIGSRYVRTELFTDH
jgi:hypothetical protein